MENQETGIIITYVKSIEPLFKKDEEANKIELILLENIDFTIVSQKNLYSIGDKVVFIQPDYCLNNQSLFEPYIKPDGNITKSKLGKINGIPFRIKAVKFNFRTKDNKFPVFSYGILFPYDDIVQYIFDSLSFIEESTNKRIEYFPEESEEKEIAKRLNIKKYEKEESLINEKNNNNNFKDFPKGLYKTDETNILKIIDSITFPIQLIGTEKIDGSSITIGVTDEYPKGFICSRNLLRPHSILKKVGVKNIFKNSKLLFLQKIIDNIYTFFTNKVKDRNIYEEEINYKDEFIKIGYPYLEDLLLFKNNFILRGELLKNKIFFFGADIFENGISKKLPYYDFQNDVEDLYLYSMLDYTFCFKYFDKIFNTKEELFETCEEIFKEKSIEGIVATTPDSSLSFKIMNLEYDSKK